MSKLTKCILLALGLTGLLSCGQTQQSPPLILHTKVDDAYKPLFSRPQIQDAFELCYKKGQLFNFGQLFVEWNKTVKPNSDSFIRQNDTIYSVFAVYRAFYKPFDHPLGNNLNSNSIYAVVQNTIFYSILNNDSLDNFDWDKSKVDSIADFRPPINVSKDKVLYLTKEYNASLNHFLRTESHKLSGSRPIKPPRPQGESVKRYQFLRLYIHILTGHWWGWGHIETHPFVTVLIFNKTLTKAKIDFEVGDQGGSVLLEKHGTAWTIKKSKVTWIE